MKSLIIFIFALLILCSAMNPSKWDAVAGQNQRNSRVKSAKRYACPMHPEVIRSRPGKCAKCGMALRLVVNQPKPDANTGNPPTQATVETASFSSMRIPDRQVYDQDGNKLNFYTDLIKGKTVAINFIFTTCTGVCPPLTATFRRVQKGLAEQALNVQLISISVDPVTDTPERLRAFADKFSAAPGWKFVTGDKTEIDSLLKALGVAVADKNDHTPMVLIGNDATGYWTRAYGLSSPNSLIKAIAEANDHK